MVSSADTLHGIVWEVECSRPAPFTLELIRGESCTLSPRFLDHGAALTLSNAYEVVMQYRDSTLATDLFYAVTGSVASASAGYISIPWTPACEAAASTYTYTIAARSVAGQNLSAFGTIKLKGSVGGTATNMPRTFSSIDWASVQHLNVTNAPFISGAALWQLQQDLVTLTSNTVTHAQLTSTTQEIAQAIAAGDVMGGDVTGRTAAAVVTAVRSVPVAPLSPGPGQNGYGLKYNYSSNWLELGPVATEGGSSISNIVLISGTSTASRVATTNAGIYRIMRPGDLPSLVVNVGGAEIFYSDLLGITFVHGTLNLLNSWLGVDIRSYDGSAAAPAHSFASGPGDGFFRFSYNGAYAIGIAVASNMVGWIDADGLHGVVESDPVFATNGVKRSDTNGWVVSSHAGLATGTPVYVESDPLSLHTQSLVLAWSPAGGTYSNSQTIASSPLLPNGYASGTYEKSGGGFLSLEMSSDSNTWSTAVSTNTPVYLRAVLTVLPLETVSISNIAVYSWLHPSLWHARPDLVGQTLLVDDPTESRQVANKTYVDASVSAITSAAWSQYPATGPVDLGTNAIQFAGSYTLLSSGSYSALSYTPASLSSSGDSFTLQCSGSDVLSVRGTNVLLAITNFWLDTSNHFNASVWTGEVVSVPAIQYTTNLLNQRWQPVTLASNSYPTAVSGSYFLRWSNTWSGATAFFRAVCAATNPGVVRIAFDLDMSNHSLINVGTNSIHFSDGTTLSPATMVSRSTVSQLVDEALSTQQVTAVQGDYPVFLLELGNNWTDFELKASTNNFSNLVYWVMSSATNAVADDTNVWTYFTDDYSPDPRQWLRSPPATPILSQLTNVNSVVASVIVSPSHECAVDWTSWMSPTNDKLVWSFARYDGIGFETNRTGTKTRWNATLPVEWRRARINP